jgi:tRNA(Ile)-lysidine synthase
VNHHLRGKESNDDARFVRMLAKKLRWPYSVIDAPVKKTSGNEEEIAREKRYAALKTMARKNGCLLILTAHTLDDQAETIVMNLLRGTGPDGLSGIWPLRKHEREKIWIGRPLLSVGKKDLLSYLKKNRLPFRSDRSNLKSTYFRNWLRQDVFNKLEKRSPGFKKRLAQLAEIAKEEHLYWTQHIPSLRKEFIGRESAQGAFLDFKKLLSYPAAIQRRFLRAELGGDTLSFEAVENLRSWMSGPPTSGRLWQLKKGWVVERLSRSQGAPSASIFRLQKPNRRKHIQ